VLEDSICLTLASSRRGAYDAGTSRERTETTQFTASQQKFAAPCLASAIVSSMFYHQSITRLPSETCEIKARSLITALRLTLRSHKHQQRRTAADAWHALRIRDLAERM